MKKELLSRAYLVLFVLTMVAACLIGKTAWISQVEGRKWKEEGNSAKLKVVDVLPDRGNIYSKDRELLASSVPYFDLHVDMASEAMTNTIFERHVDSLSICLSRHVLTSKSPSAVRRWLEQARAKKNRYLLIKRNVTYAEYRQIKDFPLFRLGKYQGGLIAERHSKRLKPYRSLAFRTIGLHRENAPSIGVEAGFDTYLKGKEGKRLMQKLGNNVWVPMNGVSEIQPDQGLDVVTTLDMRMQDIAHSALLTALNEHAASSGVAVVMEVESGKIRAMSNLKRQNDGSYWESFNHAVGDAVEPGSTFKLASMMALMEDMNLDLNDSINLHGGTLMFGNYRMRDAESHGMYQTTIRHAFEMSSNIGVAQLVKKHYGKEKKATLFTDRLRSFGLHDRTGLEIPGEGTPAFKDAYAEGWSKTTTLAWMSHGYELLITPLQLLTFYNAVANDGALVKPLLVDRIEDRGKLIESFQPQVLNSQIASKKTIASAQELLRGVVTNGTGRKLQRSHYTFAGKSGTSKLEYWKGEDKYLSSFVGYFPADKPKYSCIVMIRDPRRAGYYGSVVAGPVFCAIADFCVATDHDFIQEAFVSNDGYGAPLFQSGYARDLRRVMSELNLPHSDMATAEYSVLMPSDSTMMSLENRIVREGVVPNVMGMGLRDALYILENLGLEVRITGSGRVQRQSLKAGAPLQTQKILLSLG
ncbi:MAG: transpeptidase family protein [Saprospiraceae bacterium]|nr:transpeptidase family protein [Saprospiraceae bacterium]